MKSSKITFKLGINTYLKKYENEPLDVLIKRSDVITKLLNEPNNRTNRTNKTGKDLDNELEALIKIIETKTRNNYNNLDMNTYNSAYNFYPDYEDPLFNEKINKKIEFSLNKSRKSPIDKISEKTKKTKEELKQINNHSKKLCNISIDDDGTSRSNSDSISSSNNSRSSRSNSLEKEGVIMTGPQKFNLTNNQKFLKAFLSPSTPYNGMLLYHGTGVG